MTDKVKTFFDEWPAQMERIKHELPDLFRAFGGLFQAAMKEGDLTIREKELIAMSVALAVRCAPCMNLHVQKCLQAGASDYIAKPVNTDQLLSLLRVWLHR